MKKLLTVVLLSLFIVGVTGCQEEEPSAEGLMKDVEKSAPDIPKDHPAH